MSSLNWLMMGKKERPVWYGGGCLHESELQTYYYSNPKIGSPPRADQPFSQPISHRKLPNAYS